MTTRLLAALILLAAVPNEVAAKSGRLQGTMRQRAEQACYDDATKLCNEFVPDEEKITACMTAKKAQLSPACRTMFDEADR